MSRRHLLYLVLLLGQLDLFSRGCATLRGFVCLFICTLIHKLVGPLVCKAENVITRIYDAFARACERARVCRVCAKIL